ncbi:MAG: hypothetical protein ABI769_15310 [Pseudomonadota bacterium]
MRSIMKLMVLATVSALASVVHAADNPGAAELVRAMRSDEIAVATAKLSFLSGSLTQRYGKISASCVKRIPYEDFTAGMASVVGTVLSPVDVEASLAFFRSDAGVKYVEGLLRRLRSREGGEAVFPEVPGTEEISPPQQAAIADFSRSDLGHRIMGKELTQSPAAQAFGRDVIAQIARKCGGK